MKRFAILLVGLICVLSVSAQEFSVGVTANGALNTPSEAKCMMGYSIGVKGEMNFSDFNKGWFTDASLMLNARNWKSNEYAFQDDAERVSAYWKYSTFSIGVPISVGYKFPVSSSMSLFVAAGPYFDLGLCGNEKIVETALNGKESRQKVSGNIYKDNILNYCGCGVNMKLGAQFSKHLQIQLAYAKSLTKAFKNNQGLDCKHQDVSVGLTYIF